MHIGLMMECDYRAGKTQEEAFHEAFSTAAHAEEWGFDGVWLAERHFAPPESGRAIPSVVASPLIIATAIAAKTTRIRVGTAVLVLPLGHPVRMAEEVAPWTTSARAAWIWVSAVVAFPGHTRGMTFPIPRAGSASGSSLM